MTQAGNASFAPGLPASVPVTDLREIALAAEPANPVPRAPLASASALGIHAAVEPRWLAAGAVALPPTAGGGKPLELRQEDLFAALSRVPKETRQLIVIDNFKDKTIPIDRNNTVGDVSHGELCAAIAEKRMGRPVHRIDIGSYDAGWEGRAVAALSRLIAQAPPGRDAQHRFSGYVLSVSFGASTDSVLSESQFKIRRLLDTLAAGGASVYIAAGNDWDNTLATPRMRTVGASDGVQGFAADAAPSAALIENPGTDQIANGRVLAKPTYDAQSGRLTGWSIDADDKPEFLPKDMTDVSRRGEAIRGQALAAAVLSPAQAAGWYRRLMAMPPAEARAALSKALGRKVLSLNSLDAVFASAALSNPIQAPAGVDGRRLHVSATGVFAAMLRLARDAEVLFFTVGRDSRLQPLDNRGIRLLGPATSYSTPFAAGEGANR